MKQKISEPKMVAEYDFRSGKRGKYAEKYSEGTNIVVLSPDVAEYFHDSATVNEALRLIIKISQQTKI